MSAPNPDRLLLTYQEVEHLLGLKHRTIYDYIKAGKLQSVGSGPGVKITRASVDRLCGVTA